MDELKQVPFSVLLVTGGCGFIASNFINYVLERVPSGSVKFVNYDSLTPAGNKANVVSSHVAPEQYVLICGDVCNRALLDRVLRLYDVDTVVHFAAQTHVEEAYKDPQECIRCNVQGTVTLLEACRVYGLVKRFVYVSTDEMYGDSNYGESEKAKTELDLLQPTNPYAASKTSAEHLVRVYHKSYDFPAVAVRMCNAYGPRQMPTKVVPRFIQQAVGGKPFTIHGDGHQLRSFMHVSDTCAAILTVLTKGKIGEVYNVGTTRELSVTDLAKEIKEAVDGVRGRVAGPFQVVYVDVTKDRPYNDQRYYMDASKLKELGWKEKVPFQEGLKQTVTWYLKNQGAKPDRERILVYGAKGWIGEQFVGLLEKEGVEHVVGKKLLGDDPDESVEEEILSMSPTHIVSFIDRTHGPGMDNLEGGPDKVAINVCDNLYGPLLLAELCRKFDIHFTYIGSGCIFKYDEEHHVGGKPFTEEDKPNFFGNSYSVIKGYTDRLMHHYKNVLNVRMRLPVSADTSPHDLITKLTYYKKLLNIPNSVTVLPELLPVLLKLMKDRHTGTINLVNPGCVEYTQVLETCKQVVDSSIEYEVIDDGDESEFARKLRSSRSNCHLSTDLLCQLAPEVSEAKEAVTNIIKKRRIA